jgi:predicted nucleotidyltransferase
MNNIINNILDNIKNQLNITDEKILSIYLYGSRVYGTATEKSDYDFVVVINSEKLFLDVLEIQGNHVSVYNKKQFQELVDQHEEYIAKKSLWHSFRIIYFGIQLATTGKIINYSEANYLYDDIVLNSSNDVEYYKQIFLKSHNELMTKFRLVAPK